MLKKTLLPICAVILIGVIIFPTGCSPAQTLTPCRDPVTGQETHYQVEADNGTPFEVSWKADYGLEKKVSNLKK